MPVYKAYILNKEINVNYEKNEKEKLLESIDAINSKLETYDNLKGKISDSKLLSFLAIKLQAELIHLNEKKQKDLKIDNKSKYSNDETINLNDKIYQLREQNHLLKKENELINQELIKIQSQINIIINLVKKTYEE